MSDTLITVIHYPNIYSIYLYPAVSNINLMGNYVVTTAVL